MVSVGFMLSTNLSLLNLVTAVMVGSIVGISPSRVALCCDAMNVIAFTSYLV